MSPAASRPRTYAVSALLFVGLDAVWLGWLSPAFYRAHLGALVRDTPDFVAAALFYAIYLVGVNEFVIRAEPSGATTARVAGRGALLGLFAYATFDLTAQAVLRGWSWTVTAADLAWGSFLTAAVAAGTHRAVVRRGARR